MQSKGSVIQAFMQVKAEALSHSASYHLQSSLTAKKIVSFFVSHRYNGWLMNLDNSSTLASEPAGGLFERIDHETGDQFWEEVGAFLGHAFVQEGEGFDLVDGGRHGRRHGRCGAA